MGRAASDSQKWIISNEEAGAQTLFRPVSARPGEKDSEIYPSDRALSLTQAAEFRYSSWYDGTALALGHCLVVASIRRKAKSQTGSQRTHWWSTEKCSQSWFSQFGLNRVGSCVPLTTVLIYPQGLDVDRITRWHLTDLRSPDTAIDDTTSNHIVPERICHTYGIASPKSRWNEFCWWMDFVFVISPGTNMDFRLGWNCIKRKEFCHHTKEMGVNEDKVKGGLAPNGLLRH